MLTVGFSSDLYIFFTKVWIVYIFKMVFKILKSSHFYWGVGAGTGREGRILNGSWSFSSKQQKRHSFIFIFHPILILE